MEVKQDVMVVSVSLFGLAQRVYKMFRENIPKSWKKLMKVKMNDQTDNYKRNTETLVL